MRRLCSSQISVSRWLMTLDSLALSASLRAGGSGGVAQIELLQPSTTNSSSFVFIGFASCR
jgi:hypothetical protein